ncbi:MAG: ATP-dependent Clp protease ATP-binding subunit [Spirochaetaceae bacterium]|jgi:ATP-dependent Clp protease ATP-binding subunit ClpC|nr:ATP-dependent Clp protease ATP-binding subunit [Spirochaetaceae bacterium]
MFKGLTMRLQRILAVDVQTEARCYCAGRFEPEHILLAILRDNDSTAFKALEFLKIDTIYFRKTLESVLILEGESSGGYAGLTPAPATPSPRTKKMLQKAAEESCRLDGTSIGTEHILLAAFHEAGSCVHPIFSARNSDAEALRLVIQANFPPRRISAASECGCGLQPVEAGGASERAGRRGAAYGPQAAGATPLLDQFSRNLTTLAIYGELDPVIGREKEIMRMVRILSRRSKNNPVLVGEPGTGKSAIVEGLAQYLVSSDAPASLSLKRILSLDIAAIVAGTKYRGEFEERMRRVIKEAEQDENVVLFIDEIHTIIGAGSGVGGLDAGNMLKPALSRGRLRCIGATTIAEYRKYIERDGALERRFQMVAVDEPDISTTEEIIRGIAWRYEEYHDIEYSNAALRAAVRLSARYINGRCMPDKAIDVLDEAGALKKLRSAPCPAEISRIERHIIALDKEITAMLGTARFDQAQDLRERASELRLGLDFARSEWERLTEKDFNAVSEDEVREVVSEICGVPVGRIEAEASKQLLNMENDLKTGIIGQDEAVARIASAVRRGRARLSSPARPMGSFLFLGPTGVGKTLLARRLAFCLFGAADALFRIDMSDFMERHNAARLTGSPPGYVGYDEGGVLTEKIRRNPYSIVLFDEIEKAHRDVFNLLLPILEEGEIKDNLGHTVSFRNTVVIMTSNAGAAELSRGSLGFAAGGGEPDFKDIDEAARREAKRLFNPEFLNRLDDIVVFRPLGGEELEAILDLQLAELEDRLDAEYRAVLKLTKDARKILLDASRDSKYGARPMRRAIQRHLEDPLALALLAGEIPAASEILARAHGGRIVFDTDFSKPSKTAVRAMTPSAVPGG